MLKEKHPLLIIHFGTWCVSSFSKSDVVSKMHFNNIKEPNLKPSKDREKISRVGICELKTNEDDLEKKCRGWDPEGWFKNPQLFQEPK